jgi:hypothetical protein
LTEREKRKVAPVTDDQAPRIALPLLASTVHRERVEWLEGMEGRIALRSVNLLVGDPGLGKSLLSLKLAAGVSQDGGFALVATAEDSLSATARPRLEAAQANLQQVAFVQMWADGYPDALRIPNDAGELERLVADCKARLLVIDPLTAHLPGEINSWRDQSIRMALAPLHALAERQGCAILVLAHLNKSLSSDWLRRVGGSIGITGAARSVLLMARDPDDPDGQKGRRRIVAHVKCNVGPEAGSVLHEIRPVLIPASGADPEVETATIIEIGESDHDAERLLSSRGDPEERSALEEAVAFLEEELSDRKMDAKTVKRASQDVGISPRTLDRAKQRLGVVSERVGGIAEAGHWTWRLKTPRTVASFEDGGVGALSANQHEQTDSDEADALRLPNAEIGGLSPIPGDESFRELVDGAFNNGHLTETEWLERQKVHALIERTAG